MRRNERIIYQSDFDKHVLVFNFERRRWLRVNPEDDEDWNLYWASVPSVRHIFSPDSGRRLGEHQLVNHFPNTYELTRKDFMVKNIKRYRKEREKQEFLEGTGSGSINEDIPRASGGLLDVPMPSEWVPTTFALPNDYALFVEEFRRNPSETWIAKPVGKSQGRGIFLVSKLQQLKKWATASGKTPFGQALPFRESYIISRYINDPLLIGGKKFDMRVYVLVTSFRPLKIYIYRGGFCRFCVEQYTTDVAEFDNAFIHLTNVAIQRHADDYNDRHGGKWDMNDLMLFIESSRGKASCDKLLADIESMVLHSLKAMQSVMINDKHCFELYGFDILLDRMLKPWLLEVNASPSLTCTTEEDRLLKLRLIHDVLNIVMPQRCGDNATGGHDRVPTDGDDEIVGGFVCILDEGKQKPREEEQRRVQGIERRKFGPRAGGWR